MAHGSNLKACKETVTTQVNICNPSDFLHDLKDKCIRNDVSVNGHKSKPVTDSDRSTVSVTESKLASAQTRLLQI